jgi:D-tyrosyl-tRNA(Tyr) deacylase
MIALIQRVSQARVEVEEQCIGSIGPGLLALIGIEREDDETACARLFEKITHYRVFGDEQGRMNRSLLDQGGELLLVSQFTLAADTRKGTRPGFSKAAAPERAKPLFDHLVRLAQSTLPTVQTGRFGADMRVSLVNDGPVTFWLEA